ncbi:MULTISPECIES: hypothetical protein [Corallincola]|uniref:Uncharacterized protein n=1 Tax=Corallincola spongiicola TaxID=2520508 RepID=A0ABY1WS42_9GAMM|nr:MULTISPECIES: hypothetical protein [Corallincola]TAA47435.1 hypothetical protein EXY25_09430 [Corallincola spongiicola]
MDNQTPKWTIIRPLILAFIVIFGIAAILASKSEDCTDIGESCTAETNCCQAGNCENDRCCRGNNAALDSDAPASDCCSGQIRTGPYGPYCCATDGMTASSQDRCCEGLYWNNRTGLCSSSPCEPGCTWDPGPASHGSGECDCPGGGGSDDPAIAPCTECAPCAGGRAEEHYSMRVYNEENDFCCTTAPPFWAPDEETAEACARRICACEDSPITFHCEVERIAHGDGCPRPE